MNDHNKRKLYNLAEALQILVSMLILMGIGVLAMDFIFSTSMNLPTIIW